MRSKVGLIAYADRFGGDLAGLRGLLNGPLRGLFGGVHVLPFYRPYDGADAGFDPQDHTEVDPRLGSWEDIAALGAEYRVMADMIVNHVSSSLRAVPGLAGPRRGLAVRRDVPHLRHRVPRRRHRGHAAAAVPAAAGPPVHPVSARQTARRPWCGRHSRPQQIDVDVRHPATRAYLLRSSTSLPGRTPPRSGWTPWDTRSRRPA